jgi:GTP-binding protein Era|tara:strand:+ start:943 stop:1827 length:885 start_codon:yes stop_codon:yes gene_type:complete
MEPKKKCGTIAIVGQPNVGKSTLLNYFVGTKLSITSRKAQTTRYQLLGIHSENDTQYIFVDTPGYQLRHLNMLNRGLNKTVQQALKDVDVILFLIEPGVLDETDKKILNMIPEETPIVLAINKVDLMKDKAKLLGYIKELDGIQRFEAIVPTSVKKANNLQPLMLALKSFLPEQAFIFPEDELTDKNEKFLSAEIVREKVFRLTGQELPYSIAVEIEKFEYVEGIRRIFAAIIVDRDSHKPMIIGKNGKRLKEISTSSRLDMEKLFGSKVWLEIWVKVQKGWADDQRALKSLGL